MNIPGFAARSRSRRRAGTRVLLALLAVAWLAVGVVAAIGYVNDYSEHRGFTPLKRPTGVPAGRVITERFYSPALGRMSSYLAYVPTHYDPGRRYPVFYLLHGAPGRPQAYIKIAFIDVRLDTLIARRRIRPMILIFPDGRLNGNTFSDSEWADAERGNYESYVLDVVHNVDRQFPTLATRRARLLGGYSAGAYGATNIALHHLNTFSGIEGWSGYFVQSRSGTFGHADATQLAYNSPLDYAPRVDRQLARHPLSAFFYGGSRDSETQQLAPLVAELRAGGANVSYAVYPGTHDWGLWHAHVDQMLVIASHLLASAPRRAHSVSRRAARLAALRGRRAAAAARRAEHANAILQAALLRVCRADARATLSSAAPFTTAIAARRLRVIGLHLVSNCEQSWQTKGIDLTAVPPLLCRRLPRFIRTFEHVAHSRASAITQRCLRVASQPALPTPSLLLVPPAPGA